MHQLVHPLEHNEAEKAYFHGTLKVRVDDWLLITRNAQRAVLEACHRGSGG